MAVKGSKKIRTAARGSARKVRGALEKVPGPSSNPATNILIWDVATRGLTMLVGRHIEKTMLRARYSREKASDFVDGRTMMRSLTTTGAARIATRSVPGFLAVTGLVLAKTVFDRSLGRREAKRRGETQIAEQAENAPE